MDPYSRRFTWNLIRQHREGRVVVLITHFMDEADLLGDRIAIMGDGKLLCCGSSLFLKRLYGVGYSLTMEKVDPVGFDGEGMKRLVQSHIEDARVVSDVGTELTFQLPFSSSRAFQPLFEHLENRLTELGLLSFGMSVTTLEEVFIKIAQGTHTQATALEGKKKELKRSSSMNGGYKIVAQDAAGENLGTAAAPVDTAIDIESLQKPSTFEPTRIADTFFGVTMYQIGALFEKRRLYFMRDSRAWVYQYLVPVAFVLAGMLIMTLTSNDIIEPMKVLNIGMYNPGISTDVLPFPYNANRTYCSNGNCQTMPANMQLAIMSQVDDASNLPVIPEYVDSMYNMSYNLLYPAQHFKASVFGAVSFINEYSDGQGNRTLEYVVHGNYTAVHAGPLFSALVAEGALRTLDPSASLQVRIYPLPSTAAEKTTLSNFQTSTMIFFLILAWSCQRH